MATQAGKQAEVGQWPADNVKRRAITSLIPSARNARQHSDEQIDQIAALIKEYGWTNAVIVGDDGEVIAGHGRLLAAERLGITEVPTVEVSGWTDAQKRAYRLADNAIALNATWDPTLLSSEIQGLRSIEFDLRLTGFTDLQLADIGGLAQVSPLDQGKANGSLADRFMVPPFSVLNAREGWWQDRKRSWLALGIQSELGRGAPIGGSMLPADRAKVEASPGGSPRPAADYSKSKARGDERGKAADARTFGQDLMRGEGRTTVPAGHLLGEMKNFDGAGQAITGTSIFDPVLSEIAYRWFCPLGGHVIDPFAGGSVRGIVAGKLGRRYTGIDLRPEQIAANEAQRDAILTDEDGEVRWFVGDSKTTLQGSAVDRADFVFSCPPYGSLERYSDDPLDLSTMDRESFSTAYRAIIAAAVRRLKQHRFAAFVVGEYREADGFYAGLIPETIAAFGAAGAGFYNSAILVTAVGSLPIRVGKQFVATRKLGTTHQHCLIFVKGDPRKATEACGEVEFGDIVEEAAAAPDPTDSKYGELL